MATPSPSSLLSPAADLIFGEKADSPGVLPAHPRPVSSALPCSSQRPPPPGPLGVARAHPGSSSARPVPWLVPSCSPGLGLPCPSSEGPCSAPRALRTAPLYLLRDALSQPALCEYRLSRPRKFEPVRDRASSSCSEPDLPPGVVPATQQVPVSVCGERAASTLHEAPLPAGTPAPAPFPRAVAPDREVFPAGLPDAPGRCPLSPSDTRPIGGFHRT